MTSYVDFEKVLKFYHESSRLSLSSSIDKKQEFYDLCLHILEADFLLRFESVDSLSVQLTEVFPQATAEQKFTDPSILKRMSGADQNIHFFHLEKNTFSKLFFDPLEELKVISAFGVFYEETSTGTNHIILFCYTDENKDTNVLVSTIESIAPRIVESLKTEQREITFISIESRLQSILKTIPQALVFVDTETDISWINENAGKLFSLSQGSHPSHKISSAMRKILDTTSNLPEIQGQMTVGFADPNLEGFSTYWMIQTPEKKVYQVQSQIIKGRKSPGRLWLFDDVTAIHTHQETLTLLNAALKEKSEAAQKENLAKTVFISKLSHEIRTPLTGIIGLTELLLSYEHKKEVMESLELIERSSHSLLKTINHFLDFAKVETGNMELESLPFSLPAVLFDLAKLLETEARKKNNKIIVDIPDEFPKLILGDSLRIGQIFTNLVGNALKFTNEGEVKIQITILSFSAPNLLIRAQVIDTGIGISSAKLDSIFEPFVQTDASITRNFGGTGLGLSVAKNLISLLGGAIQVKSKVGEGTEFFFEWATEAIEDKTVSATGETPSQTTTATNDYSDLSVLVVEDNPVNQKLIGKILGRYKIKPVIIDRGEEAVELSYQNKYDLIFMDIDLPGIDGFVTSEILRSTKNGQWATIIGLTANLASELSKKASFRFMNDLFSKPYNIPQIEALLADLTEKKKSKET